MAQVAALAAHSIIFLTFSYTFFIFDHIDERKYSVEERKHLPEEFEIFKTYQFCFFTCWNFGLEIVFLFVAIADEVLSLINLSRSLNKIRSYLFTVIVFPSTLLVASIFWTIFLYDRQLILPKAVDVFFPLWMNHTMHSLILLPLVVEMVLADRNRVVPFKKAIFHLTFFLLIYAILFNALFLMKGVWLYPIFGLMSWPQRGVFSLIFYGLGVAFLTIGVYLQSVKKPVRAPKNKKK